MSPRGTLVGVPPTHPSSTAPLERARRVLAETFGHAEFRPAQARVVEAVLRGRDVLAVLPTGAGKSVCFQVPALLRPRATVVVSPLLSLMDDQVTRARARGIAARAWTSASSAAEVAACRRELASGALSLLYVSPERLAQPGARAALRRGAPSALVVDEAHCVSEWGHDFRPSYLGIAASHRAIDAPPLSALTATATAETRRDIEGLLGMRRPIRILVPVDRPNLRWDVVRVARMAAAFRAVRRALDEGPGGGRGAALVYVPTRVTSARAAVALSRLGIAAAPYHAGLPVARRRRTQEAFLSGRLRVVCATSAFGMGIDHPHIRSVVHLGAPASIEAYVQEAGRAGRDGAPARCTLVAVRDRVAGRDRGSGRRARRRDAMRGYVLEEGCRRAAIARYFGERAPPCAGCDNCDRRRRTIGPRRRFRPRIRFP